ncbi:MAG TPA: NAD-dependent epimerase/dehydratase family protein, partial [Polyangiales bacterium]|nr:NAD-dependent epimerase/dehydratase family protein [Polyangiales bacterium]
MAQNPKARASVRRPSARASQPPPEPKSQPEVAEDARAEEDGRSPSSGGAVVITGICGRMGQLLARRLHRDMPVIGIDRRRFDGMPADIVHHQIDVRRRKTQDIFRGGGIRAVVHLGVMHNLRESDRTHHSWNVVGFQKLLEYVSLYNVPKLVVMSSAMLYGPSPDNPHF